jgi:hypothetical protein
VDAVLMSSPEATSWCNVAFPLRVGPHVTRLWLTWEESIVTPDDLAGTDPGNVAARFVSEYVRMHPLRVRQLLSTARGLYEATGGNEQVGRIPAAQVRGEPTIDAAGATFNVGVAGRTVVGRISSDLVWSCAEGDARVWASAKHAALDFMVHHVNDLRAAGFDASVLGDQLSELNRPLASR